MGQVYKGFKTKKSITENGGKILNGSTSQKIKLLVLYELLYRLTDEEHLLNTDEIINLLKEKGINVSRKILREDIKTLNDYGYEVMEAKKKFFIIM